MIKVSIIVPVYNVSKYIIRCVNSIISQTYANIECILVDDCSPDDSMVLIEQRLKSYTGTIKFKILYHEQNKGLSGARNTGTMESTGDYLYYLDSDDEITPNGIETLVALVTKYPGLEMAQGNTQTIPELVEKNDWRNIRYKDFPEYVNCNKWIFLHFYDVKNKIIPVNAWNKLIKREFLIDNDLFFKEGIIHEDELWVFYIVKKMNSIAFTKEYTYIHYITPNSIMQSDNNYKSIQSWYVILNDILSDLNNLHFDYYKKKYIWILYSKMRLLDLDTNELELYQPYKILVKDSINHLLKKKKIKITLPLCILLMPPFFYKSFVGRIIFRLLMVLA